MCRLPASNGPLGGAAARLNGIVAWFLNLGWFLPHAGIHASKIAKVYFSVSIPAAAECECSAAFGTASETSCYSPTVGAAKIADSWDCS